MSVGCARRNLPSTPNPMLELRALRRTIHVQSVWFKDVSTCRPLKQRPHLPKHASGRGSLSARGGTGSRKARSCGMCAVARTICRRSQASAWVRTSIGMSPANGEAELVQLLRRVAALAQALPGRAVDRMRRLDA